tara:strand:- start:189555 stop:189680 length:126 start_codon:yes stop_codon:yes gene_type:complete
MGVEIVNITKKTKIDRTLRMYSIGESDEAMYKFFLANIAEP